MENLSLRTIILTMKRTLSINYIDKSNEDFVEILLDPIISKFNIKNKWGYLLHLDRSWVSKCINNHKGFETHGELKKIFRRIS